MFYLHNELTTIAAHLRQIMVQVRGRRLGLGSGVIWRTDGLIVTNAHVVADAQAIVKLVDGRVLSARVIDRDTRQDLAALKVEADGLVSAVMGDSQRLRVGEWVLAMGHPLGWTEALTSGIVSALPTQPAGEPGSWIEADIRLAPGNSGGPLVNGAGEVVGINSRIVNGRGYAIPSQTVQQFLAQREAT